MTIKSKAIFAVISFSSSILALAEPMIVDESFYADNIMCNNSKFLECANLSKDKCVKALTKTANDCSPLAERRNGEGDNWKGMERFSNCYNTNMNNNLGVKTEKLSECFPILAPDLEKDLREKYKDNPKILRNLEEGFSRKEK